MTFQIEVCTSGPKWIDQLKQLRSVPVFHTFAWGEYCKERFGYSPHYLLLGTAKDSWPLGMGLIHIDRQGLASWRSAPVFVSSDVSEEQYSAAAGAFCEYARALGCVAIEDGAIALDTYGRSDMLRALGKNGRFGGGRVVKRSTLLVDLTASIEQIFARFHPSVAKNVRKCERAGVEVRRLRAAEEIHKLYLPLLREHRARMGLPMPPSYPEEMMWRAFRSDPLSRFEVFVAFMGGEPVAGLGVIGGPHDVREIAVAQSARCFRDKIQAQDLIKVRIFEWAKEQGVWTYDLAGIAEAPRSEKEKGIFDYKSKFGGTLVREYSVKTIFNPLRYLLEQIPRKFSSVLNSYSSALCQRLRERSSR